MKKANLYTLNEFTKHDRKFYGFKGHSLGKPIRVKTVMYYLGVLAALAILRFIPIIGYPLTFLPFVFYFIIPGVIAYSLSELETEKRNPLLYARAVILFEIRRIRGRSYYRGKVLEKPKAYKFYSKIQGGYLTYKEANEEENK